MFRTILLLSFFCFDLQIYAGAQDRTRDSLLAVLAKAAEDTNKVNLYREVGISVIYQNPPEAIPYFKRGILLAKELQFNPGLERCYAATSTAFAFNAKYDSALVYIDTAIFYARKVGDVSRLALVYLNRADALENLNDFEAALKNCDTAMHYAEQSGNRDRLARIYNIISDIYVQQKQFGQAMSYLDKASVLFAELKNMQMIGKSFFNKGIIYRQTNETNKAIQFYQRAIAIADSVNDIQNLSAYTGELAVALSEVKRFKEAEAAAQKALIYARKVGNKRQESVIFGVFFNIYFAQNNLTEAIKAGMEAYRMVKEEKDLLREQRTAALLADAYLKTGNTKEAYTFLKISRDLNDSLLKRQFSEETAKLQTAFNVAQKDKEIQLLNKDKQIKVQQLSRQRFLIAGAVVLVVLSLAGIGLLISRNRLRQQIKEMELRSEIAADLHDEVGSSLSSIYMLSEMASGVEKDDRPGKEIMIKVADYAKETMEKMGDIVWMIKPAGQDGMDLKERMQRFLYEMCSSKNIHCTFEGEKLASFKMSMQQKKAVYLVFKEALNNALKYADAKNIAVSVAKENQSFKLVLKDDGKGFDLNTVRKGNGLDNMMNRAKELGGRVVIQSKPGDGTTITFIIPV